MPKDPVARKAALDPSRLDKQQALLRTALDQNRADRRDRRDRLAFAQSSVRQGDAMPLWPRRENGHSGGGAAKEAPKEAPKPEVLRRGVADRAARVARRRFHRRQELDAELATSARVIGGQAWELSLLDVPVNVPAEAPAGA